MNKLNENIFHQYNKWKSGYVRNENSLQMRLNNFLSNKEIRNVDMYHISEDGKHVDCDDIMVKIYDSDLIDGKFPFPFGKVKGDFGCWNCKSLISLEGAPKEVGGFFNCTDCENLTSLEGAPKEVGGHFSCYNCENLTSLEGAPEKVGKDFSCSDCKNIKSLKGAPEEVGYEFTCNGCKNLKSLEGAPKKVSRLDCIGCESLTSLEHLPKEIGIFYINKRFNLKIPLGVKISDIRYI